MGRRGPKNHKKKKDNNKGDKKEEEQIEGQEPRKKFRQDTNPTEPQALDNALFERYYRIQLASYFEGNPKEFDEMWSYFKEKLPIVFRVNENFPNYENFTNKLNQKDFLEKIASEYQNIANLNKEKAQDQQQQQQPEKIVVEEQKVNPLGLDQTQVNNLEFKNFDWYPKKVVYQLNISKHQLKHTDVLKKFHLYLQRANDAGLITRQELVSMVPPLFMSPKANERVFDMCAAPGSKTAQLLELMQADTTGDGQEGVVAANDVDTQRAYMLTHQINRANAHQMIVLNHQAQFFPALSIPTTNQIGKHDHKYYFDKVLADVPCSGDGATRKIPDKWTNWNTNDAQTLHPLQLSILMRGVNICKVGGYVLYSTCSINPIEDEAVLTELFRKAGPDVLELVDVHELYPGLKGRRGLSNWKVLANVFREEIPKSYEEGLKLTDDQLFMEYKIEDEEKLREHIDAKAEQHKHGHGEKYYKNILKRIKHSMRPIDNQDVMTKVIKIQNSMRLLPHDNNSGGFFVALIKKVKPFVWVNAQEGEKQLIERALNNDIGIPEKPTQQVPIINEEQNDVIDVEIPEEAQQLSLDEEQKKRPPIKIGQIGHANKFELMDEETWKQVQEQFGLEGLDRTNFFISKGDEEKSGRKYRFISKGVYELTQSDQKGLLNPVMMGAKAFEREREGFSGSLPIIRLCQDAINMLFPYIKAEKKVKVETKLLLELLNKGQSIKLEEVTDENFKQQLEKQTFKSSFILYAVDEKGRHDGIVAQAFRSSVAIMVSKDVKECFWLRYA